MRVAGFIGVGLVAVAIVLAPRANASDATLRATLHTWSQRIAADARSLQLTARQHHPRRLSSAARRFRADALAARRALALARPSTRNGWRARKLGLAAFADYAIAGRDWEIVGRARVRKQRAIAIRYARIAKSHATRGGRQLVAACRLV